MNPSEFCKNALLTEYRENLVNSKAVSTSG
jgi:hypothetical protein